MDAQTFVKMADSLYKQVRLNQQKLAIDLFLHNLNIDIDGIKQDAKKEGYEVALDDVREKFDDVVEDLEKKHGINTGGISEEENNIRN